MNFIENSCSLKADLSIIHVINNYKCNCGASFEDAMHCFLECSLYLNEKRTLLSDCDDININIEILLFGNDDKLYQLIRSPLLTKYTHELMTARQNTNNRYL
jgi:hypothetical protein